MIVLLKKSLAKTAIAAMLLVGVTAANATLIIDNGAVDTALFGGVASTSVLTPDGGQINSPGAAVDSFALSGKTDLSKITFWTYVNINARFVSNKISVAIFEDEPGVSFSSPVWAASSGLGHAASIDSVFGLVVNGFQLVKHELTISALQLEAGNFLLHVGGAENNVIMPPSIPGFPASPIIPGQPSLPLLWAASSFTPGANLQSNLFSMNGEGLVPGVFGGTYDLAFTIEGTVVEASAPATLALIGLSLAGLLLRRKVS